MWYNTCNFRLSALEVYSLAEMSHCHVIRHKAFLTFFLTFLLIFYAELFLLTEVISQPGLRQLQLNQISTNRRNAVFFCQILLVFVLYMLHNSDIVYQGGGCT